MTAINHAMTGAIIGLVSGNPLVALPAALVSHFVCDAIPHFGASRDISGTKGFRYYLVVEALLCVLLVVLLALLQPAHWLLAGVAAFVAASPDFLSINKFLHSQTGREYSPGLLVRFAKRIQWFERPIGAVVEIAWASAAAYLLVTII